MDIKKQLKDLKRIIKQNEEGAEQIGQIEADGVGRVYSQGGKTFLEVKRVGDSPDYPATAEITQEDLDHIATSGKFYGSTTLASVVNSSGAYSRFVDYLMNQGRIPKWTNQMAIDAMRQRK